MKTENESRPDADISSAFDVLGPIRLQLLVCTAPPDAPYPGGLTVAAGDSPLDAYRVHVKAMQTLWGHIDDPGTRAPILALTLMAGDLDAADELLALLPHEPIQLDHGAGYCHKAPFLALRHALPWPEALMREKEWVANSDNQSAARSWLNDHRSTLNWNDQSARFFLS